MSPDLRIKEVLSPWGYSVHYEERPKYLGSDLTILYLATKGGVRHYARRISHPEQPDHYRRIAKIEDFTPRMARIIGPIEDVVLSVEAPGEKLWEMEIRPDPEIVEAHLLQFQRWAKAHDLVHGDLRPWNVFFDQHHAAQVIDLNLSAFVDDLLSRDNLPPRRVDLLTGHYAKCHPDLVAERNYMEIDRCDALRIGKLLRGEIGLSGAWPPGLVPLRRPSWCRP